jgi:hypothetical protein
MYCYVTFARIAFTDQQRGNGVNDGSTAATRPLSRYRFIVADITLPPLLHHKRLVNPTRLLHTLSHNAANQLVEGCLLSAGSDSSTMPGVH